MTRPEYQSLDHRGLNRELARALAPLADDPEDLHRLLAEVAKVLDLVALKIPPGEGPGDARLTWAGNEPCVASV